MVMTQNIEWGQGVGCVEAGSEGNKLATRVEQAHQSIASALLALTDLVEKLEPRLIAILAAPGPELQPAEKRDDAAPDTEESVCSLAVRLEEYAHGIDMQALAIRRVLDRVQL